MHGWHQQPQRGATRGMPENKRLEKLVKLLNLPSAGVNFMPYNDRSEFNKKLRNRALMC